MSGATVINLAEERLNRGLSIRQAAKAMGIGADVLGRAENGAKPHPGHRLAIAKHYGYRVTDIWPVEEEAAAA